MRDGLDWLQWLFVGVFGLMGAVLIGLIGFIIYDAAIAETFSLRKDHWKCTKSHSEETLVMAGKVMMPIINTVCDQWTRK